MNAEEVQRIVTEKRFPGATTGVTLLETHISWVILTDTFAFKIKKPLHFHFLDFSTLEARRHFCEEELRLNRRLAPNIYLGVLPVGTGGIGDLDAPALDYAVQMRRMDNEREMDKLLVKGLVSARDMEHLAALLVGFHLKHRLPPGETYQPETDIRDFGDLFLLLKSFDALPFVEQDRLRAWELEVPALLEKHAPRQQERMDQGFWVDGHGDLHSRNIFLPLGARPLVFDALEFNPAWRRMDVLNELGFLCMDLEYFGRNDLARAFMQHYTQRWACLQTPEDEQLFLYFKAYRANVRLKVSLMQYRQHCLQKDIEVAAGYWRLLATYLEQSKQGAQ